MSYKTNISNIQITMPRQQYCVMTGENKTPIQ